MISALLTLWFAATPSLDCTPVEKEIEGTSLQGQLMPGQKVMAVRLGCREMRMMDFVIFTSEESSNLVIKQIWGMPGDLLSVDEKGYVFVNGEHVLTPFDKPYRLNPYFKRKLKKFEGALEGYLLMGHPGSLDSGRVGPIALDDIVGIVEKDEGRDRQAP